MVIATDFSRNYGLYECQPLTQSHLNTDKLVIYSIRTEPICLKGSPKKQSK